MPHDPKVIASAAPRSVIGSLKQRVRGRLEGGCRRDCVKTARSSARLSRLSIFLSYARSLPHCSFKNMINVYFVLTHCSCACLRSGAIV